MQACAPALCDTALQNAIHFSPRRKTWAEWCYCINIGKVKTRVMWRTTQDRLERAAHVLNAKLVLWYAIQRVCATNNTGAEWETRLTCQGLMRKGNIFSVKRQRVKERSVLKCILRQNGRKSTELWGDYLTVWQNYMPNSWGNTGYI